MTTIVAVCTSEKKGTVKKPVPEIILKEEFGVVGDAHADCATHRQVSLLAIESIDKMRAKGFKLNPGDFAENITTSGIELTSLPIGARLKVGDEIVLEMTQIGKECHASCEIRRLVGDCIMPREGVFTRVIHGGRAKAGDAIKVEKKTDKSPKTK
jgi:MOSC domain-containing protein YiiM